MAEAETQAQEIGEQDQSMEEILQSIRRIIAEESDEPASDDTAADAAVRGSDVLELTEIVNEDGTIGNVRKPSTDVLSQIDQALAPAVKPLASFQQALEQATFSDPVEPAVMPPAHETEQARAQADAVAPVAERSPKKEESMKSAKDSLLSQETIDTSAAAMRSITENVRRETTRQIESGPEFRSGNTVEDLALEALRPMLKSWLDNNLPAIVERIVEKEVRRLSAL